MAERSTSYLTIQQIVRSFMLERNEKSLTNFERYLNLAIEGFSDIAMFNINSVNVAYLSVNTDTNVCVLPVDFVSMTKIGVKIGNSYWTLTVNNDIVPPRPETICQNPIETITPTTDVTELGGYWFAGHWLNGGWCDTLYGTGGGWNTAYYKIDMANRVILLDGIVPNNEIILEYISTNINAGGSPVPRVAAPAVKAYLHWKSNQYDIRYSLSERDLRKQEYNFECHKLKLEQYSFNMSEFLDTLYSTYSQAPKR